MTDWTREKHDFVPKRDEPQFCIVCDFPHNEYNIHNREGGNLVRITTERDAIDKATGVKPVGEELDEIIETLTACKDASPATAAVIRIARVLKRLEHRKAFESVAPHQHVENMLFG